MGKSVVNLDDHILEINEDVQAIVDMAKRKEQQRAATKTLSVRNMAAEKAQDENVAAVAPGEARAPRHFEAVDGTGEVDSSVTDEKARRSRPKSRNPRSSSPPGTLSTSNDDPWVAGSIKIRNSKKSRLHRLSRTRELEGLVPFQKQDLMDEALDYLFEKYSDD